MGYTKKWVPPTIPLRDDLAAWKTLFQDLHDNLILAGLVQSATPGQLDISAVSALPADGTFEGFIEYEFDDDLQATAPVVIKLEYGCGVEGLGTATGGNVDKRTRTPLVRCTVSFTGGTMVERLYPQGYQPAAGGNTTQLTSAGSSAVCYSEDTGFFGLVYGAGSRNKPWAVHTGSYYGATLTLFLQRSVDATGAPTGDGLAAYVTGMTGSSNISNLWTNSLIAPAQSVYMESAGSPVARTDMAPRIGREGFSGSVDEAMLEPIHFPSNPPKPFPYIVSYRYTDISTGYEFDFRDMFGNTRNFIALGRETCMSIDSIDGQRAGIAMLFE